MQSESFRLNRTERTNNQIQQGDAVLFARNPIDATYNQLPAMFTRTFHTFHYLFTAQENLTGFHSVVTPLNLGSSGI
jgi:hypothetical protein